MGIAVVNKFRKTLLNNEISLGTWLQLGHPGIAEIMAAVDFDWICVDLEHGSIEIDGLTNLFNAIEKQEVVPVVRLPMNDPIWIRRTLDAGALGLVIPMVNSAEEIESAIQYAKYSPRGKRGYGYSRANCYGRDFEDYIAQANENIAVIAQIEHKDGIANLDSILKVPDLDAVFIGPLDLSGSYGKTGQLDCPEMRSALASFLESCKLHNICPGLHIVRPDEISVRNAIQQGYKMIALSVDGVLLEMAASQILKTARHVQSEQ